MWEKRSKKTGRWKKRPKKRGIGDLKNQGGGKNGQNNNLALMYCSPDMIRMWCTLAYF